MANDEQNDPHTQKDDQSASPVKQEAPPSPVKEVPVKEQTNPPEQKESQKETQPAFTSALERAKAMAARLSAASAAAAPAESAQSSEQQAAASQGIKRPRDDDSEHPPRPHPSAPAAEPARPSSPAKQSPSMSSAPQPAAPPSAKAEGSNAGSPAIASPSLQHPPVAVPPYQQAQMPPTAQPYQQQYQQPFQQAAQPAYQSAPQYGMQNYQAAAGQQRFGMAHQGAQPLQNASHYGPPQDPSQRRTIEVIVPAGKAGIVIGRGGETLRGIERQFNVRVQLEPAGGGGHIQKTAIVTGGDNEVELARRAILDVINGSNRGGNQNHQAMAMGMPQQPTSNIAPGPTTIHIHVPSANGTLLGLIIGKGGETIRSLQAKSGARITVAKESEMEPGSTSRLITISGTDPAVAMAQHLINEIVHQHEFQRQVSQYGPPPGGFNQHGMYCEVVTVPANKIGLVIGRGGDTIKIIQSECGVVLKVDPNPDANGERRIALYGQPDNVARAKQAVFDRSNSQRQSSRSNRDSSSSSSSYAQQPQQQYSYAYQTPAAYGAVGGQTQAYGYGAYGQYDANAYAAAYAATGAAGSDGQPSAGTTPTAAAAGGAAGGYDASQYQYDPKAYAEYYAQYAQYYGYDPNAMAAGGDAVSAASGAVAAGPEAGGAEPKE